MSSSGMQRTVRRGTAILTVLLSLFIRLFQGYMAYQGHSADRMWPIARYISLVGLVGGVLYLVVSAVLSLLGELE